MTPLDLPALRGLCERATKGPWWVVKYDDYTAIVMSEHVSITDKGPTKHGEVYPDDAAFIAAARTALPAAVAEIEALMARVAELESAATVATHALLTDACNGSHTAALRALRLALRGAP